MSLWSGVTEAAGDTWAITRLNSTPWTEATEADKLAALTTAQADLMLAASTDFPTEDADITDAMVEAVFEQALFLLLDPDTDARAALQSQGVTRADPVGENYRATIFRGVPIAPKAVQLVKAYLDLGANDSFTLTR